MCAIVGNGGGVCTQEGVEGGMEIAFASRVRRGDSTTFSAMLIFFFFFFCSASASALKLAKLNFLSFKSG